MRALIFDYFRRYRWIFIGSFLFHILALLVSWQAPKVTILVCVLGGSAFLLFSEIGRHGAKITRTLISLPLTAEDISKAWRFVGLVFPILYFLVALLLSVVAAQLLTGAPQLTCQRVVIAGVFQSLLLGVAYYALTGVPIGSPAYRTVKEQLIGGFYGLIWGISIPGSIFLMNTLPTEFSKLHPAHIAAAGFMFVATVAGWFRAGLLVRVRRGSIGETADRFHSLETERRKKLGRDAKSDIVGFGGVGYLMLRFGRGIGIIGLAILLLNWYGMSFFFGKREQGEEGGTQTLSAMDSQLHFVMPILGLITAITVISQLRTLRSLPISRAGLTNVLIFWPLLFTCAFAAVASLLYRLLFDGTIGDLDFWLSSAGGVFALAGIPVILRFGLRLPVIFVLFFIFPMFMLIRISTDNFEISPTTLVTVAFSVAGVTLIAAWFFTYRALGSSPPWRAGALKLPGQVGGGG